MTTHCDKTEVLHAACHALRALIDVCPQVLDVVGDESGDNSIPLHRCCMFALMLHLDDPDLCQEACQVLASIVNNSSSLREVFNLQHTVNSLLLQTSLEPQVSGMVTGLSLFVPRSFGTLFLWKYNVPVHFYYLRRNSRLSFLTLECAHVQ